MFDKQAVFNFVAEKIIQQGRPSIDPINQKCVYRHYDKESKTMCKCAIGHLIPDDGYKEEFEKMHVWEVLAKVKNLLFMEKFGVKDRDDIFLNGLQYCHDFPVTRDMSHDKFIEDFKIEMRDFAIRYSLDTSILEST